MLPTDDKERKRLELYTFMFEYFPDAWLEVVKVAAAGNDQHNLGQPMHWARDKSKDQMNTAFRHIFDYGMGTKVDTDGTLHLAKAIWRLMAQLQLDVEAAPAEAQKPLRLEAGKRYVTRSGQVVGPLRDMLEWEQYQHEYTHHCDLCNETWCANGNFYADGTFHHLDIVREVLS